MWVVDVYLQALAASARLATDTPTHTICCDIRWLNPSPTSCNPVHSHSSVTPPCLWSCTHLPTSLLLVLHTPLTLYVPTCHFEPHPFQCPALPSRRYVAACAPHIQEWLFYPPLRGSYDYIRLTRDNHLPNPSWLYSQGLSTVWDAKVGVGLGAAEGRRFQIQLKTVVYVDG